MTARFHNLDCEQGGTFEQILQLKQNGAFIDLTGHSAEMQVRSSVASEDVIIELSTVNGRIVINPELGELRLQISAADTAAIVVPRARSGYPLVLKAVYDLLLRSPDGFARFMLRGEFNITAGVTR